MQNAASSNARSLLLKMVLTRFGLGISYEGAGLAVVLALLSDG